jgi:hypothetical protein
MSTKKQKQKQKQKTKTETKKENIIGCIKRTIQGGILRHNTTTV